MCSGKVYRVHKFVLSMCSEYFETMFEEITERNPLVVITGVEAEELEYLLKYMYNGRWVANSNSILTISQL